MHFPYLEHHSQQHQANQETVFAGLIVTFCGTNSISSSAEYGTLCRYFSHLNLVIYFFPEPNRQILTVLQFIMQNHILSSAGDALSVRTQATCKLLDHYFSAIYIWNSFRVDRPMTEHLSKQERPDPSGPFSWCPNKSWTPSLDASDTPTIVENRLEMRKLHP